MTIQDLDTPALVVDLDIMERNLTRVARYCADHKLQLRPHTKTHKSIALARRQLALGAVGLTVAKVGEAEVMLGAAPEDLLIAYPVFGPPKLRRITEVAKTTAVTLALDSIETAAPLSAAAAEAGVDIGVLVEVDVGMGRVGVSPDAAVPLAKQLAAMPNLHFRGITFYPGHIKDPKSSEGQEKMEQLSTHVSTLVGRFSDEGLRPGIVSGGSTPALFHSHQITGLTEIRPGTYIFNDLNTVASDACTIEDCAATVLVTVVSQTRPGHMIIDGGSKTFSSDRLSTGEPGHGRLVEAPESVFTKMNEEHGYMDISAAQRTFSVGEKVQVIPNHVCVVVNLHEQVYGVRNGQVEEVWKVEGRGKLQ